MTIKLPPLGKYDHPEPKTMKWTDLELDAIKAYATKAVEIAEVKHLEVINACKLTANNLRSELAQVDRRHLQANCDHPAPCSRSCEANAFEIEIRGLKAEIERLSENYIEELRDYELTVSNLRTKLGVGTHLYAPIQPAPTVQPELTDEDIASIAQNDEYWSWDYGRTFLWKRFARAVITAHEAKRGAA